MSTLEALRALAGNWTGTSTLYLPGDTDRATESYATVAPAAKGKFYTIAYTWMVDDQPQEGLLLLGYEPDQSLASGVFIDSWHMGDALMVLRGEVAANDAIDVRGSYPVPDSPDWGWRIVVEPTDNALSILMYNVSPDGEEHLGVKALYTRA